MQANDDFTTEWTSHELPPSNGLLNYSPSFWSYYRSGIATSIRQSHFLMQENYWRLTELAANTVKEHMPERFASISSLGLNTQRQLGVNNQMRMSSISESPQTPFLKDRLIQYLKWKQTFQNYVSFMFLLVSLST